MALQLLKTKNEFSKAIILSGDEDFLPILKYLQRNNKTIIVLSRSHRTAREIRQFAKDNFRDFDYLRELIKMSDTDEGHTSSMPSYE